MRVFVAGATGALGRPVVRRLVEAGHEVTGMTRTPARRALLESLGARPVVADALAPGALSEAVGRARPEAVLHLLTALPPGGPARARDLRTTNELRRRATTELIAAAQDAGAHRLVAESFVGVYGFGCGNGTLSENSPRPEVRAGRLAEALAAMRSLEDQVAGAHGLEGVVLRFGLFYGPGVGSTEAWVRDLARGRLALPAGGPALIPWIHIEDAAAATVAALERGRAGEIYNVVDDEPATLGTVLGALAEALGTPPPRRVPAWLGRLVAPYATAMATRPRLRVSNAKAKSELSWAPAFPTWRQGVANIAAAAGVFGADASWPRAEWARPMRPGGSAGGRPGDGG